MLIVIEGADRTGKTTLAKQIAKEWGYEYYHFGRPGDDPAREYADFLLNLRHPTVCDRFFLGELVYGPMLRGKDTINTTQKITIERLMRLRGTVIVHANPEYALVSDRFKANEANEGVTADQNLKAYYKFTDLISKVNVPVIEYDGFSNEEFVTTEYDDLHRYRGTAQRAESVVTGIGTIVPDEDKDEELVLIVGDTLNIRKTWLKKPFDGGTSAKFLNEGLSRIEDKIYIVNQDTFTSNEYYFLRVFWSKIAVIALGENASKTLTKMRIKHETVPHPAYWTRFEHGDLLGYRALLEGATYAAY